MRRTFKKWCKTKKKTKRTPATSSLQLESSRISYTTLASAYQRKLRIRKAETWKETCDNMDLLQTLRFLSNKKKEPPSHPILSISNRVVDSPPELVKVFAAHFFKPEPSSSVAHLLKVNIATSVLVSSAKFFHPVTQKELIFAVNSLKKSSSC